MHPRWIKKKKSGNASEPKSPNWVFLNDWIPEKCKYDYGTFQIRHKILHSLTKVLVCPAALLCAVSLNQGVTTAAATQTSTSNPPADTSENKLQAIWLCHSLSMSCGWTFNPSSTCMFNVNSGNHSLKYKNFVEVFLRQSNTDLSEKCWFLFFRNDLTNLPLLADS